MELVSQEKKKLQGDSFVTQYWVDEVLHLIASHHGLPEYGSVKPVQSIEAGILSRADYISSRNGMIETVLKDSIKSQQPLQESFRVYGDSYFASSGMKKYVSP
jgi:23S rRNA maturation-related 3'-5' exoribonuclease YhaM